MSRAPSGRSAFLSYCLLHPSKTHSSPLLEASLHFNVLGGGSGYGSFFIELRALDKPMTETGDCWYKYDGVNEWTNKNGGEDDSSISYGESWQQAWSKGWKDIVLDENGLNYLEDNLESGELLYFMLFPSMDGAENCPCKRNIYQSDASNEDLRPCPSGCGTPPEA